MHNHTIKATVEIVPDSPEPTVKKLTYKTKKLDFIDMEITVSDKSSKVMFNSIAMGQYFEYAGIIYTKLRDAPINKTGNDTNMDFGCAINTKSGASVGFWGDSKVRPAIVTHMTVEV